MKQLTLLVLLCACAGCATGPGEGPTFDPTVHAIAGPDAGRLIVFHHPDEESAWWDRIGHEISINGGQRKLLAFGGFLSVDLPAGRHSMHADTELAGEDAAKVLTLGLAAITHAVSTKYKSDYDFEISPGEVKYLAIKDVDKDVVYECDTRGNEASLCAEERTVPEYYPWPADRALQHLKGLVEINK